MTFESDLRQQLLTGAERRRRHERRRTALVLAAPVLIVAVLLGALWLRDGSGTNTTTVAGITPQQAACSALFDYRLAATTVDAAAMGNAMLRFAPLADESGDPQLIALAQRSPTPGQLTDEDITAIRNAIERCQELGAPEFARTFVPAALGPEPMVELAAYGTEQAMTGSTESSDLGNLMVAATERNMSPIELARNSSREFITRYSYGDEGDRMTCTSAGDQATWRVSCNGESSMPQTHSTIGELPMTDPRFLAVTVAPDVSFVTIEKDGTTYVQRPAAGAALIVSEPVVDWSTVVARAYDEHGKQLGCTRMGPTEPARGPC